MPCLEEIEPDYFHPAENFKALKEKVKNAFEADDHHKARDHFQILKFLVVVIV